MRQVWRVDSRGGRKVRLRVRVAGTVPTNPWSYVSVDARACARDPRGTSGRHIGKGHYLDISNEAFVAWRDARSTAIKAAQIEAAAEAARIEATLAEPATDEDWVCRFLRDAGWTPDHTGWTGPPGIKPGRYTLPMGGLPPCIVSPAAPPAKCPCISCTRASRVAQLLSNAVRNEGKALPLALHALARAAANR